MRSVVIICAGAALAACASSLETVETKTAATAFLETAPQTAAIENVCVDPPDTVFRGARLRERVYASRFYWADLAVRDRSILVQFTQHCGNLKLVTGGLSRTPLCTTGRFTVGGELCRVEEIYEIPDERAARALALRVLVDEAREAGRELPASNADAADVLIAEAG